MQAISKNCWQQCWVGISEKVYPTHSLGERDINGKWQIDLNQSSGPYPTHAIFRRSQIFIWACYTSGYLNGSGILNWSFCEGGTWREKYWFVQLYQDESGHAGVEILMYLWWSPYQDSWSPSWGVCVQEDSSQGEYLRPPCQRQPGSICTWVHPFDLNHLQKKDFLTGMSSLQKAGQSVWSEPFAKIIFVPGRQLRMIRIIFNLVLAFDFEAL